MAVTDVIRPVSVRKTGATTTVPSGTIAAVTADNSDASYIAFVVGGYGNNWSLRMGSHTPGAGYERHRMRGRIRIRTDVGTCTEDIDIGRGTEDYIAYHTANVTSTLTDKSSVWLQYAEFGLDTVSALDDLNLGGGWVNSTFGGVGETRTTECYIDIDCRYQPDYSPEIRDGAGADQAGGTVTDTNQPALYFGAVGYDGLPELDWSVTVRDSSTTIVDSQSGSGAPPLSTLVDLNLVDDSYTAEFTVRSTIRGSDPFTHTETLSFDVANEVPPPSPPLVGVTEDSGGYLVTWTDPGGQAWDNGYVVAEVWRDDCTGSYRIAVVPDGLNGSYLDLAIPQLDPQPVMGPDCEVSSEPCDLTYRVRYQGYVSELVELPSALPADMILGWPSTAASIPSGWSRVTSLDGYHVRGSSGSGAPTTTGGAASHTHTTPGHTHTVGSHSHSIGGSTGSSNSSTTSARFNGASQTQADQPHTHTRPSSSGTASSSTSGSSSPAGASTNNAPPARDVIWIKNDGAQTQYPVGVLGFATESVAGWSNDSTNNSRYLKGAAAAGDGGATSGASTHTHTVASHNHTTASHDHSIAATGLSNPLSSIEAGYGSSTPRWLPRHTHPMNILATDSNDTASASGGTSGATYLEPPNRRLKVLANTGGGIQTRIIGLFVGTVASIDPLMTLCDGGSGTPDMRTYFARDAGSDSVNSTSGTSSHTHTTPSHTHGPGNHSHLTDVLTSTTGSFEAPSFGDLGDSPTTTHDHSSNSTSSETPSISSVGSGTTNSQSHLPVYKEVHFVRLDGTISGDPLAVPELRISEFASVTVPSLTYTDDLDRLSSPTDRMEIVTERSHAFPRLVIDDTPLDGGLHTVATTITGEDLSLSIAVEGLPEIDRLETLLSNDRVYFSPLGGTPGWFAPAGWSVSAPAPTVKVLQVSMVLQSWPSTADPEDFL